MDQFASGFEKAFWSVWCLEAGTDRPQPQRQHRFDPQRRFTFDFAWPELRVAVEICGVEDPTSKYRRPWGLTNFFEKLRLAQIQGWIVLAFSSRDLRLRPHACIEEVEKALSESEAALKVARDCYRICSGAGLGKTIVN